MSHDALINGIAEKHYQKAALSPEFIGHSFDTYKAALTEFSARQPAEAQEPVAWMRIHPDGGPTMEILGNDVIEQVRKTSGAWKPLYTHPAPLPDTVSVPVERLERWKLMFETDSNYGMSHKYSSGDFTPNSILHNDEAKFIGHMLAAAPHK